MTASDLQCLNRSGFLTACQFVESYYLSRDMPLLTALFSDTLKAKVETQKTNAFGSPISESKESPNKDNYIQKIKEWSHPSVKMKIVRLKIRGTQKGSVISEGMQTVNTTIEITILREIKWGKQRFVRESHETIKLTVAKALVTAISHTLRYEHASEIQTENTFPSEPKSKIGHSLKYLKAYLLEPNEETFLSLFTDRKKLAGLYEEHFRQPGEIQKFSFETFDHPPFKPEYDLTVVSKQAVQVGEETKIVKAKSRLNFDSVDFGISIVEHRLKSKCIDD